MSNIFGGMEICCCSKCKNTLLFNVILQQQVLYFAFFINQVINSIYRDSYSVTIEYVVSLVGKYKKKTQTISFW